MSISSLATLSKQAAADAIISKTRTALASRSFALSPDPNVAQSIFQAITYDITFTFASRERQLFFSDRVRLHAEISSIHFIYMISYHSSNGLY
jgi:hypothetical protein